MMKSPDRPSVQEKLFLHQHAPACFESTPSVDIATGVCTACAELQLFKHEHTMFSSSLSQFVQFSCSLGSPQLAAVSHTHQVPLSRGGSVSRCRGFNQLWGEGRGYMSYPLPQQHLEIGSEACGWRVKIRPCGICTDTVHSM